MQADFFTIDSRQRGRNKHRAVEADERREEETNLRIMVSPPPKISTSSKNPVIQHRFVFSMSCELQTSSLRPDQS